jgi:hypothetical protein
MNRLQTRPDLPCKLDYSSNSVTVHEDTHSNSESVHCNTTEVALMFASSINKFYLLPGSQFKEANGKWLPVFRYPPVSCIVLIRIFGKSNCFLATCFQSVSCLASSFTLKMEANWSSDTSTDFKRTTRLYIREDIVLRLATPHEVRVRDNVWRGKVHVNPASAVHMTPQGNISALY